MRRTMTEACIARLIMLPVILTVTGLYAQTEVDQVQPILKEEILPPAAALFQLKQYILSNVHKPPSATSPEKWTDESKRLREKLLKEVVFHGWPNDWVNAAPRFEDAG
ncbi:MAG TPA: hypothetical protein VE398_09355, partial [Acidobacteriota bacterium]|nr:hypothetical protein [Acidobacteriota bacterium]